MITTIANNVETREMKHTEGFIRIATYYPSSCPWDCYVAKKAQEWRCVLSAANIPCETPTTSQTNLCPTPSGSGGYIRFGDNMMPGFVSLYVSPENEALAIAALASHDEAIQAWLFDGGKMPEACR